MLSSTAVFTVNALVSFSTLFIETAGLKSLLTLSQSDGATHTAFTTTPTVLYLRRERTDRHHIANVFDDSGVKIYTIERRTMFTPIWSVLTVGERREVATMHAGLLNRYFDMHCKPDIRHRDIPLKFGSTGATRQFHLNDGTYEWNSASMFLERIVNPGAGDEEIRRRVAKVRQMRTMRFDFEVLVDESMVDKDVALVTAYISMLTQWGIGSYADTRGPTLVGMPTADQATLEKPESHQVDMYYEEDSTFDADDSASEPIEVRRLMLQDRQALSIEGSESSQPGTFEYTRALDKVANLV